MTDEQLTWEAWRKQLASAAGAAEARATSYKKLVRDFAAIGERGLVHLFKDIQHDEESYAKRLRAVLTEMNWSGWGFIAHRRVH